MVRVPMLNGPEHVGGVRCGHQVGRSMRFSLVSTVIVVLLTSLALYGVDPNFNLTV